MIDRVTARLGRRLYEVPVGFKWFVDGLARRLARFRRRGERGRGVPAPRRNGLDDRQGWHRAGAAFGGDHRAHRPRSRRALSRARRATSGRSATDRVEAPATPEQKQRLAKLSPQQITITELAGEPIERVLDRAPGNDAPIGGIKVIAASGWFAARPSGTEDIYKIYAESFRGEESLRVLLREAQEIVDRALSAR